MDNVLQVCSTCKGQGIAQLAILIIVPLCSFALAYVTVVFGMSLFAMAGFDSDKVQKALSTDALNSMGRDLARGDVRGAIGEMKASMEGVDKAEKKAQEEAAKKAAREAAGEEGGAEVDGDDEDRERVKNFLSEQFGELGVVARVKGAAKDVAKEAVKSVKELVPGGGDNSGGGGGGGRGGGSVLGTMKEAYAQVQEAKEKAEEKKKEALEEKEKLEKAKESVEESKKVLDEARNSSVVKRLMMRMSGKTEASGESGGTAEGKEDAEGGATASSEKPLGRTIVPFGAHEGDTAAAADGDDDDDGDVEVVRGGRCGTCCGAGRWCGRGEQRKKKKKVGCCTACGKRLYSYLSIFESINVLKIMPKIKILLATFQIVSGLGFSFNLRFPPKSSQFFHVLR